LTKSKVLDKELQTLTAEEQRMLVSKNGLGGAVAPLGDAEEARDDEKGGDGHGGGRSGTRW